MVVIRLKGQVTADGRLQFEVPDNLPPGAVEITLEIQDSDESFTEDEIKELLTFTPTSGAEVVAAGLIGGWEHKAITDSVAFVEALRRQFPLQSKDEQITAASAEDADSNEDA